MIEQYHDNAENHSNPEPKQKLGALAVEKVMDIVRNVQNRRLLKLGGQWQLNENGDWVVSPPRFDSDGIRDNMYD